MRDEAHTGPRMARFAQAADTSCLDSGGARFTREESFGGALVPFVSFKPYAAGWKLMNEALKLRAEASAVHHGRPLIEWRTSPSALWGVPIVRSLIWNVATIGIVVVVVGAWT